MQDHVYVQYLELNSFQTRFREISASLNQVELSLRDLNASASSVEDANALLDTLDAIAQTLAVESSKARDLIKLGMCSSKQRLCSMRMVNSFHKKYQNIFNERDW